MKYVLYNPLSDNRCGKHNAEHILTQYPAQRYVFLDITALKDEEIFALLEGDGEVIVAGGDGTLSRFANTVCDKLPEKTVWYYPCGSGNDFMNDINGKKKKELIPLNKYLEKLPTVTVKGRKSRFINGIGFGLDGYCCEVADIKKQRSERKVNYPLIAFFGLMHNYTPCNARVTVDGVTHKYEHCWMVPTMNGRYFGGGIMIAPNQDRLNPERTVSVVTVSIKERLSTLFKFPSIFKGKHLKYTDYINVFVGKNIRVEFDRPTALQIDGDTVRDVLSYTVTAYGAEEKPSEEKEAELQL